jgi:hypothetical protein
MRDDQVLFSIDSGLHVVADHARWSPSEGDEPVPSHYMPRSNKYFMMPSENISQLRVSMG